MDSTRTLLIALCCSLARLQIRLVNLSHTQRFASNGRIYSAAEAHWTVEDMARPSSWFEDRCRRPLSGAIAAVALAQAHLLAMVTSEGDLAPRDIMAVIHSVPDATSWTPLERRIAAQLHFDLTDSPQELFRGVHIHNWAMGAGGVHANIEMLNREPGARPGGQPGK